MNLIIDKEFKTLIPPLSEEEYIQLEENCVENGIQDSLKVWDGILIDGHNRYEIAQKHGLEFKTEEMNFSGRNDVKYWIIKNQLGRRNISLYDRSRLALMLKPVIAEKAKEKQAETLKQNTSVNQKSDERKEINTNKELAKVAGVSHDTIHKVEVIEKSGDYDLKQKIRNKDISINKAYKQIRGIEDKPKKPKLEKMLEEVKHEPVILVPAEPAKVEFIETEESAEVVADVAEDVSITFAKSIASEIETGMTKILNTEKYSRANVVEELFKINSPDFSKDHFKTQLTDCIRFLVHLENCLTGWN